MIESGTVLKALETAIPSSAIEQAMSVASRRRSFVATASLTRLQ